MAARIELDYPNREKAASRITRLVTVVVLLISTALIAVVTVRGWDLMQDARTLNVLFVAVNLVFVIQVLRWSRGALPMAAGIAAFVGIFSGVSVTSWYERDASGYREQALSADLGAMTFAVVVLQVLVILVTIKAFTQNWQEEVERTVVEPGGSDRRASGAATA